jgi:peptidoglycan/xylan/chitin deacetylase (PgdA/CDA1 family)
MGRRARVPFAERGGTLRGVLDLVTGRYPLFLLGGRVGRLLPVFHLHDVDRDGFDRQLQHLADRGYRTVTSDVMARLVRDGVHPGPGSVALCFDDARATLWTVAAPLLRKYGFRATAFAIPARIQEAPGLRPTVDDGPDGAPTGTSPFVTWPELSALQASGIVDVQSHTYAHASIFCSDQPMGFVGPDFAARDVLDRPLVSSDGEPTFLTPDALGAPLYLQRSRMSDARRFFDAPEARQRCVDHVHAHGGASFFTMPGWAADLTRLVAASAGQWETDADRQRAIEDELARARDVLADRLRVPPVRHLCFPWGVAGRIALDAARRVGYETAFSERLLGFRAVRAGDDPYRLMRLNGKHIVRLPRVPAHVH